ncbi:hypothetical protein NDU88_010705 [Pleurodeles waltl]|uniref:Uncharacterized protein n=1 Tax=Pleurodeles waltl TaxID=8319 RepID=A0AAV7RYZ8_PLEWA|nr:hypothetical protein NDU88_000174 [Pleurodeles waltl]KAJ1158009.1 hypothetical protein NDU88_010705 [Pleurodeles waltl]
MSPWRAAGLVTAGDFYSEDMLLTFDELSTHTKILASNLYCTIRHLLHITWGMGDVEPPTSQILTLLLSMGGTGKAVSRLYSLLLLDTLQDLDYAKSLWDETLPTLCPRRRGRNLSKC